jgi:hypothetical protein
MTQEEFDQKYTELVNDRISTGVIQDEIWRYHPNNPNAIKVEEASEVNPLHHENIHFNKEYDKEKRRIFFS